MRVGIFTDTYLPDINGVVSSVELLRKQLEKNGHDAYVICTYKGINKVKIEGKIIRLPGVEIKKLYGYAITSPVHFLFIEELKKLKLDIIHAETEFGVGIFANIVASTLNLPLVRTYHTTYEDYTHYVNFINSRRLDKGLKKLVVGWSKLYCDNCVKLITPSKKTMEMLTSYGVKTPIDIVPTGVELNRFKDENTDFDEVYRIQSLVNLHEDEKLLVFVGRIAQEKSIDEIIKAFSLVKENNLKVKLMIVGGGPSLEELKSLTKHLNLEKYIYFMGKQPFDEVVNYYKAADGFISASTSETQGMTYIEALSSGLVVLARHDEVLEGLIKENENGYFFNKDIYEAIEKFDSLSKDELSNMKEACMASVDCYDADTFGASSIRIYEEALEDYKYSYVIEKTTLKDNCVELTLRDFNDDNEKLTISMDTYSNMGLRKNSRFSKLNFNVLKEMEVYALSYRSCLKRLANSDYSIEMMYSYLYRKYELNRDRASLIIDELIEKGLLDDYRYASGKVNSLRANLYSKKKMAIKLAHDGVSDEIIDRVLVVQDNDELALAIKKANKYLNIITNKSYNAKKTAIMGKLLNDGFEYNICKEAMSSLDFSTSLLQEKEIIRKEANKALKKYSRKYTGTDLRNHIYLSLANKGFGYDDIYALINEMEL